MIFIGSSFDKLAAMRRQSVAERQVARARRHGAAKKPATRPDIRLRIFGLTYEAVCQKLSEVERELAHVKSEKPMTRAILEYSPAATPTVGGFRTWTMHLWAFVLPLINLVFLVSGPHSWWGALVWTMPVWILVVIDNQNFRDHRQPPEALASWPFDLQLYLLIALQLVNHVLLGVMASKLTVSSWAAFGTTFANLVGMIIVSGTTAGYSGIVLGHELVHRRNRFEFLLGRVLLAFVCYEHFATEHVRGHHPRLGTREDPATARYGEDLKAFIR